MPHKNIVYEGVLYIPRPFWYRALSFIFAISRFRYINDPRRKEACDSCKLNAFNKCMICGCYLKLKQHFKHERCPIDRWPK